MIYAALLLVVAVIAAALFVVDRMAGRVDAAHRQASRVLQTQLDEAHNRLAAAAQGALYLTPPQIQAAPDPHAGMELWTDDTGLIEEWVRAPEGDD